MRLRPLLGMALLALVLPVAALPGVPYCPGSVSPVAGAPQQFDPALCEAATGRVFPEASALSTPPGQLPAQDFVSFFEFQAALAYLEAQHPDFITVHTVADSVGWDTPTGHDSFPVYLVEVTDEKSPMPLEQRQALLFMLSIHGVEKGGREGGFRVIEDLLKGVGFAAETVQDGAGLPKPITTPAGKDVKTYGDYLGFQRLFFLFPNPDGWVHDEPPYTASGACAPNGALFCRTNGNGVDLNRQAPTMGWQSPQRNPVGEVEAVGYYNWLLQNDIAWSYAIDIHGMLNHQNFAAIMLPAASMTPQEMQRSVRLAETLKDRLNNDEHFAAWRQAFGNAETAEGPATEQYESACAQVECPLPGSALGTPSRNVGSPQLAEYYTVIDAIGYTDSGFNGDYFAQDRGLNAPGYDIELAYNHITVDSAYPGAGAVLNDYHVKAVREIVKSYMDAAALDVKISFETSGLRTLYLEPTFVATSTDDGKGPGGWAEKNAGDDIWDTAHRPSSARPAKYWEDLRPFLRHGDEPGVLVATSAGEVTRERLDAFDTFVIPGSAIEDLEARPGAVAAVRAWVEAGGELVLTDEALRFLDLSGVTDGAVDVAHRYMGGIKMDLSHPLLAKVRGGVMQMYEPTPLGFAVGANAAPNWFVDAGKFQAIGGEAAGRECGSTVLNDPDCDGRGVALGRVQVGAGRVQFIGALLPDPTEEFYHPYGLDHYATTYSGNQVLRNMLGWNETFEAAPIVITGAGIVQSPNEPTAPAVPAQTTAPAEKGTPGPGLAAAVLALAAVAVRLRRR